MTGKGYIKSLDGLRAIAVILVMTFHAQLTSYGWIGVQLFFVLSGYLITKILLSDKKRTTEKLSAKFKRFWIRRSLRIFPLYYAYIIGIGISFVLTGFPDYYPVYFPYIITYTANFPLVLFERLGNPLFNHLWSLSIEEQFYLLFPLIILFSSFRLIRIILLAIICLSPLIRFFVGEYYIAQGLSELTVANGVNFNTLCQLDAFCLGGLIPVFSLESKIRKPFLLLILVSGITLLAGYLSYRVSPSQTGYFADLGYNHYFIGNLQHIWHYSILNLFFATTILAIVSLHARKDMYMIRRILDNNFLVRIGKVSYGMYLFHWLIWVYIFARIFNPQHWGSRLLLFIPYLFTVYLISEISYRFFEVRFIKMKDSISPSEPVRASIQSVPD